MLNFYRLYSRLGSYGYDGAYQICLFFRAVRIAAEIHASGSKIGLPEIVEHLRDSRFHPLVVSALLEEGHL